MDCYSVSVLQSNGIDKKEIRVDVPMRAFAAGKVREVFFLIGTLIRYRILSKSDKAVLGHWSSFPTCTI